MTKQNKNILYLTLGLMAIALTTKGSSIYASALNFIKIKEGGLYLKAYQDSGAVWTIGWGSIYDFDKQRAVQKGDVITQAQAQKWLEMETSQNAIDLKNLIKVPINNNQLNALISLVYNIGINGFKASTMLKLLNSGADKQTVALQFDRWIYDNGVINKGLVNRRNAEKKLFLS